jgi:hypothetical protein
MKFIQALFFVSLFSISARCQPYLNIANFQFGKYEPSTVYKGSNDWETTTDYIDFNINLPIRFKAKQLLLISPRWMQKSYFSESPIIQNLTNSTSVVLDGTSTFNSTYNSLMFPVSWVQPLKDTTKKIVISGIYRFNYEIRLNPSSSNDQIGGAVIYSKKYSKKFGWQAGLYYNRETFGNLFLPLIGAFIAGFFGRFLGKQGAILITTILVSLSALFSFIVFYEVVLCHSVCSFKLFT